MEFLSKYCSDSLVVFEKVPFNFSEAAIVVVSLRFFRQFGHFVGFPLSSPFAPPVF